MDDVLFGAKRAYWASAGFAARKLAKYGITPARLNLLRVIYAGPGRRVSQRYVRHHLGVARSTVCRMIRALEALGLVVRDGSRLREDRRTLMCELTLRGSQLVATIYSELVHTKEIARAIDAIWPEPQAMRVASEPIFAGLALSFGRWGPVCAP